MRSLLLLPLYIQWHFGRGLKDFEENWYSILRFSFYFFSIPILFRTLFLPWRRLSDTSTERGAEAFLMSAVVNVLMRAVGFVIRFAVIIAGLVATAIVAIGGALLFLLWIFLPLILVFLIAVIARLFFEML